MTAGAAAQLIRAGAHHHLPRAQVPTESRTAGQTPGLETPVVTHGADLSGLGRGHFCPRAGEGRAQPSVDPGSRFSGNVWASEGAGVQGGGKGVRSSGRLRGPKEGVGVELKAMVGAPLGAQSQAPGPGVSPVTSPVGGTEPVGGQDGVGGVWLWQAHPWGPSVESCARGRRKAHPTASPAALSLREGPVCDL